MENEPGLLIDLVAALGVALAGGWLATRIGLSSIAGYVFAGVLISSSTPGFAADVDRLRLIADIGVVLLLFGIGVQYSLRDLTRVGWPIGLAALAQVSCVMAAGTAFGVAIGWETQESLFAGGAIAISSTAVIVKLLSERGEIASVHGRIAVAWGIVQDLAAVVIVAVLIAVADEGNVGSSVGLASLKALAFIAVMAVLGLRVVPWLLARIAEQGSRELFVLAIAALALGTALASEQVGLSLALGAFIAGLVVSEADLSHQVLGDLLPARDVFAVLFFVSAGMLIDVGVLRENALALVVLLLLIVVAKGALSAAFARIAGQTQRTALAAGALLTASGEFSFVLIGVGVDEGVVSSDVFSLVVAATAISVVLAPILMSGVTVLNARLTSGDPALAVEPRPTSRLGRRAVICGYGEVGRTVAGALASRFEVVVIDQDRRMVADAAAEGLTAITGDASTPAVIELMGLEDCRVLVVAISDPFATRLLVERARAMYPDLDVIARALNDAEAARLRRSGAGDAVVAGREVALEMVRHSLHRFGVDARQALAIVQRMRTR